MYFNENGDLVTFQDDNHCSCIPHKHVEIIYWNLIAGKSYDIASPIYQINRQEAAFILNNYSYKVGNFENF